MGFGVRCHVGRCFHSVRLSWQFRAFCSAACVCVCAFVLFQGFRPKDGLVLLRGWGGGGAKT